MKNVQAQQVPIKKKPRHPLIETLFTLTGSTRACVWTEPLWGIPYNLYSPYASLYMAAMGLNDADIGLLASVGMLLQFFWAMMSGALTDKYGRRWTTVIFDVLSWSVPCALWAIAQGYWYFLAAVFFNGMWRITDNSWSCLLVDDCDRSKLVSIYTLVSIAGFLSGFVSPLAGLLMDRYTLVPTMRVLYWLSFTMMTAKFLILFFWGIETEVGKQRMRECKDTPLFKIAFEGVDVFLKMIRNPLTLMAMLMMLLTTCSNTVESTFLALFVTDKYGLSERLISFFPFIKAILSMIIFFTVTSKISHLRPRRPLLIGFGLETASVVLLLVCLPLGPNWMGIVFFAVALGAVGRALVMPMTNSLMTYSVDMRERARSFSMFYSAMFIASAPAGWIAGLLSEADRALPFALNLGFLVLTLLVSVRLSKLVERREAAEKITNKAENNLVN